MIKIKYTFIVSEHRAGTPDASGNPREAKTRLLYQITGIDKATEVIKGIIEHSLIGYGFSGEEVNELLSKLRQEDGLKEINLDKMCFGKVRITKGRYTYYYDSLMCTTTTLHCIKGGGSNGEEPTEEPTE